MKPEVKQQYLTDFLKEVREAAFRYCLMNYVGGKKRVIQDSEVNADYCTVLGVRMAIVWNVTRSTANRRLQSLSDVGVMRRPRYGFSHCDSYSAEDIVVINFKRQAIQHWLSVGYSQTELLDPISTQGSKE